MASLFPTGLNLSHHYPSFRTYYLNPCSCSIDSPTPSIVSKGSKIKVIDYTPLIETLRQKRLPDEAHEIFIKMKTNNLLPNYRTLSALMLCFAENGSLIQARMIWEDILHSSFVPDIILISKIISTYENIGCFNEVTKITKDIDTRRHSYLLPVVCSLAIRCFAKNGQLELMEKCYGRVKKCGVVIKEEEIRDVLLAYLKERKFYRLREFVYDIGLNSRYLWNSVLLSYAADFKMKSLQREFLKMLGEGYSPDVTTFNIRALAFSKMALFWDLHLTIEHMRRLNIVPDLVTFGCVVDAYVDRRLARNLEFVYKRMNLDDAPVVLTDPLVFEVLGKGDFHLSAEAVLEFSRGRKWTYRKLIGVYLKKKFRRDQIFWNY